MHVELVSPEGILFEGEATMVVARTLSGDIAFLQGHVPFIGSLAMHPVKIVMAAGTNVKYIGSRPTAGGLGWYFPDAHIFFSG